MYTVHSMIDFQIYFLIVSLESFQPLLYHLIKLVFFFFFNIHLQLRLNKLLPVLQASKRTDVTSELQYDSFDLEIEHPT